MNNQKSFGELLAYHRGQFGISQEELAEISGVSKIQIARYETNKAKPRRKAIENLSKALKITPEDLGYRSLDEKHKKLIATALLQVQDITVLVEHAQNNKDQNSSESNISGDVAAKKIASGMLEFYRKIIADNTRNFNYKLEKTKNNRYLLTIFEEK